MVMVCPSSLGPLSIAANSVELNHQTSQYLFTNFGMRDFSAPEHHRGLDLVFLFQKPENMILFEVVIMFVDFGPKLDLLDLDRLLMPLCLLSPLALLIAVLSIIHDSANRRIGRWCNFH